MRLKIMLPAEILLDQEVTKVVAVAANGAFCLLPRHVDFATALVPGILAFERPGAEDEFVAVDEGVLVKCGAEVLVSVPRAVRGAPLGELRATVEKQFRSVQDQERTVRAAAAKLEAELVRRFIQLQEAR